MLLSNDGYIGDFCCPDMERYTIAGPDKCVGYELLYKKVDNDIPEPRFHIYPFKESGRASQEFGGTVPAGKAIIPISYCPFCGKEIEFR